MPIISMADYQKGKIYWIWDTGFTKCYIGSTVEDLSRRMTKHRAKYKAWLARNCRNVSIFGLFEELGIESCTIELIENYPCNSIDELKAREGHHQREKECVNKCVAGRTKIEWDRDHKEHVTEYFKRYNQDNKDKIRERRGRLVHCQCGSVHVHKQKARHERTQKHQNYVKPSDM